ncbi:MAG: efflux RND transporter periplasmic adaptor subunit [Granulosicoccus sp.]
MSRLSPKRLASIALPVVIVAAALFIAQMIKANKPQPLTRPTPVSVTAVDATRLQAGQYPVVIRSQGSIQPTLANTLVPEVAGTVVDLSASFVVGGVFKKGDLLVQVDRRDYEIALTQANANLAQAQAELQEQSALAQRAVAEWKSLGRRGDPSSLTLREPQMAAAKANRDAAQAQVQRAELDLERTRITAPYDGRVGERNVDAGQFVTRGTPIGWIHAISSVDVLLPLSNRQLTYLRLPSSSQSHDTLPNVELSASIGGQVRVWTGKLIRAEGVDAATQQLNVIARIEQPYSDTDSPLRVGQFVQAKIAGEVLESVFVIPRSALREEREVLVINKDNEVYRRAVSIAWSDDEVTAIKAGLRSGDVLVTTPLSTVADGTPVRATIDGEPPPPLEGRTGTRREKLEAKSEESVNGTPASDASDRALN